MNSSVRLLAAALAGAAIALAASTMAAGPTPSKHPVDVDTCTAQIALLNDGISLLTSKVDALSPDSRDGFARRMDRDRATQAIENINSRLSGIERSLNELAVRSAFPPVK